MKSIAPAAYHVLIRHRWPGNVGELRNVMERACLLARGSVINVEYAPRIGPIGATGTGAG